MSNRQAAVLASRIICAWFIYSAVLDLAAIPKLISVIMQEGYWLANIFKDSSVVGRIERTVFISSLSDLIYLLVNVAAAIFFYRGGPRLIRFLTGENKKEELLETTP
jgi:hypothetical protein